MITAIGTDIVELNKIRFHSQKKYFLDKVFTKKERDYADGRIEHLATTFAAKEAVFKALGTGWLDPKDIEVARNKNGKPSIVVSSNIKKLIKNKKILLSLSFSNEYAVAFAVIK